ncbi:MAG TPA: class I SAM-dependent methyltransferase [Kofleriaceae bacterium]|nr:class I SAM-dependent methyltransferase [Kofleriaceae bacterium]
MIRALAKGAVQLGFGRVPGGHHAYRAITRGRMGTAATHVDKLARVWPGYVAVWKRCGVTLDGAQLWTHDAGATPFMPFAAFLLTGRGAIVTDPHERFLDRYLQRARSGALDAAWPAGVIPDARRNTIEGLRWITSVDEAVAITGARCHAAASELADSSVDLCHSGGALEHLRPDALAAFVAEVARVLRPGGLSSHVFDHRDHLHHADRSLPFLAHLAWPDHAYRAVFGHSLGYHSRLSPTEVDAVFASAGLERILVRRLIYRGNDRVWVDSDRDALAGQPGVARTRLAARFASMLDADLRVAAAHYLFRKLK